MITTVREDNKGLFIVCDGYIGRYDSKEFGLLHDQPKSKFKFGDRVSCTHPAGSDIFVKSKSGIREFPEIWRIEK